MPIRGNSVIVDHGGGVKTGYHHLLDTSVVVGQQVEAGALLGHVGSTGFSTGPHLHWELTIFGVNVDPETWTTRVFPR
jgi:murein DD-endopeptidase MepM/ murein hydrolase activator NlpD